MKLLIAHDGSECADAALNDLLHAGLPSTAEVVVLSVGELTSELSNVTALAASTGYYFPDDPSVMALNEHRLADAQASATQAAKRLQRDFPTWTITTEAVLDTAETAIVQSATDWKPDLIAVGSHGRSGFRRFFLGSVSQHVLKHTHCSVRIGRSHRHPHDQPIRLLLGIDGSPDATAALQTIAARKWPSGTQVRVVGVLDYRSWLLPAATEISESALAPVMEEELRSRASETIRQAVRDLKASDISASPEILAGNPGHVLVAEAERWDADCIFVGARGLNALERIFLGSVSTTVAMQAHCSVEVVRQPA